MKLHYYPETDSLYYRAESRSRGGNARSRPGLNVDLGAAGDVVGFDIDGASRRLDLTTLETIALPTQTTTAA